MSSTQAHPYCPYWPASKVITLAAKECRYFPNACCAFNVHKSTILQVVFYLMLTYASKKSKVQERQQRLELLEAWEQTNQGDLHRSQPMSKAQEAAEVAQQDQQEGLIQALATSMFNVPQFSRIF